MRLKRIQLERYVYKEYTKQSAKSYLHSIDHFLEENPNAEQYKRSDIITYLSNLSTRLKDSYKKKILASIKVYYNCLLYYSLIERHPCSTLNIAEHRSRKIQLQELFTSDELELLLQREDRYEFVTSRNKVLISLLIYQGISSQELVNLKMKNINMEEGYIHVRVTGAKTNSRKLALIDKQFKWFEDYIEHRDDFLDYFRTDWFIMSKLRTQLSVDGVHSVFDQLKPLFPERRLSPKTIRHSVISNWLNVRKFSVEYVMQLSGIKHPSTIENYRQTTTEKSHEMMKEFHPLRDH